MHHQSVSTRVDRPLNACSAQANLQTALTGANAFWMQGGQTYSGIDVAGNTNVSNISEIDTGVN